VNTRIAIMTANTRMWLRRKNAKLARTKAIITKIVPREPERKCSLSFLSTVFKARLLHVASMLYGLAFALSLLACLAPNMEKLAPKTFIKTINLDWTSISLKDGLSADEAWNRAQDVVSSKFELEMISKDANYLRSAWRFTRVAQGRAIVYSYRTRVSFKFSPDKKTLLLKVDAQFGEEGNWLSGYDADVLESLKQDITALVGR